MSSCPGICICIYDSPLFLNIYVSFFTPLVMTLHLIMGGVEPPAFIPQKPELTYVVDCLYEYTYVWLLNGDNFWFYPTRVEYGEVSGYRWNGLVSVSNHIPMRYPLRFNS